MPDDTTSNAQVAKACLQAGERPNKTVIFISGFVTLVPSSRCCRLPALEV